jgi:hypothetical protein
MTTINLNNINEVQFNGSSVDELKLDNVTIWEGGFELTISSNVQNLNLRSTCINNGWNGSSAVTVTIGSGKYIWSDSTSLPALDMGGSFPGGVTLVNNGYIMGKGGRGQIYANGTGERGTWITTPAETYFSSADAATDGGTAIKLTGNMTIDTRNGYIGGGGGGGAGHLAGGGAGGGEGGKYKNNEPYTSGSDGNAGNEHMTDQCPVPSVGNKPSQSWKYGNSEVPNYGTNYVQLPVQTGAGGSGGVMSSTQPFTV